jgi:hypothetical protein
MPSAEINQATKAFTLVHRAKSPRERKQETMEGTKVLSTFQLRVINENAKLNDFNRILADEFVDSTLDKEGFHVAKVVVPFHERHHFNGDPVDDALHHRLVLLCKVNGSDDPATAFVDITADDWDALPELAAFIGKLDEVISAS